VKRKTAIQEGGKAHHILLSAVNRNHTTQDSRVANPCKSKSIHPLILNQKQILEQITESNGCRKIYFPDFCSNVSIS
jgi:hypothetical protein